MEGLLATVAYAATAEDVIETASYEIVNPIILILFSSAFIYFVWGVVQYIRDGDDKGEGRKKILWGLIGLFIIFSVFGIINLIIDNLGALVS